MSEFTLRAATAAEVAEIWELNQTEVPHVGDITLAQMHSHFQNAARFTVVRTAPAATGVGKLAGFLLAFDETASYQSPNYLWFKARYPDFVYVDRLAVAPEFRKSGIGRRLYADIEAFALPRTRRVTCEVNLRPSNETSLRFHRGIGFNEVGVQDTDGGEKTVSLLLKTL
ncbi:MAG: GNAT family N-acetyltransferase [Bacteriovoracia bacterium]